MQQTALRINKNKWTALNRYCCQWQRYHKASTLPKIMFTEITALEWGHEIFRNCLPVFKLNNLTYQRCSSACDCFSLHQDFDSLHQAWPHMVIDKWSRVLRIIAASVSVNIHATIHQWGCLQDTAINQLYWILLNLHSQHSDSHLKQKDQHVTLIQYYLYSWDCKGFVIRGFVM